MSSPSGCFRFRVIDRLLRCRFWKSGLWRSIKSGVSSLPGISILMTCAPQSANCLTAVGPARARVRSRTLYLASALDAGVWRIGAAFLLVLSSSHDRSGPAVGTLMTRGERNACWVSTLPSPLSCFFARHRCFPYSLALHARQGEASWQATPHPASGNTVAAVPLTIFACSTSGSIGYAHGLFHVYARVYARAWPCHGATPS